MKQLVLSFLCLIGFANSAQAIDAAEKVKIQEAIKKAIPEITVDDVKESEIEGLYEVNAGPMVFYASEDGRYVVHGDMLDLTMAKTDWNVTENARKISRAKIVNQVDVKEMVTYPAERPKTWIAVFTDVDCGYCRQFHQEVAKITEAGVEVRYLAFPRRGVGSASFDKAVSIWCASDPKEMMSLAKGGQSVPDKSCSHPVEEHFKLGQQLGVRGTPSIIFEDGTLWPGYLPAEKLVQKALKHRNT